MSNADHVHHSSNIRPSINMTPLIDVLLVLLVIFMVVQPQREEKLPIRAPQPAPASHQDSPEILFLEVSPDFTLELNRQPIELEALMPLLTELMQQRPLDDRVLFIRASPSLRYESAVLLIDLAKGAGALTVGLLAAEI